MNSPRARRVVVVGGGISGLAAAHRLVELRDANSLPLDVTLFEAADRLGGVVSTVTRDGYQIEEGPDSIITDKPWARDLAERLGLADRIIGTQDENRRSFVVRRGRLEPTPDGFYLLAPTRLLPLASSRIFSPLGKLRMSLDLVIPRRPPGGDESVGGFVRRRLGREALERMAQPMIGGIYGADPEKLSLRATFPRFLQMEEEHGSVIRAMVSAGRKRALAESVHRASGPRYGLFISFDLGMRTLTDALSASLPEGAARTGVRVSRLEPTASGRWRLATGDPDDVEFDAVILALRAHDAAHLLRSVDPDLSGRLGSIAYGSAATVSLAFREQDVDHRMDGFGFVVPTIERLSVIGCTFVHRKYPGRAPAGQALIRAFWGDSSAGLEDREIVGRTLGDLRALIGVRGAPLLTHLARYPGSMPHYAVGHLD
ncbi:MAG TPA: protoporphyrinogen oxidase, partial [Patescibacteria group bacterium]|nr:protoporphyrinogen oxidase [Patescibacteria group bacterium]